MDKLYYANPYSAIDATLIFDIRYEQPSHLLDGSGETFYLSGAVTIYCYACFIP
jgi:hypothetical protein